jgi:hypothetical protein
MRHRYFRGQEHDEPGKPSTGETVIRGLVRARLLGVQLLTLEARVVVRPDDGDWAVLPLVLSHESRAADSPPAARQIASPASEPRLERAIDLVEQSADTLERSRRLR